MAQGLATEAALVAVEAGTADTVAVRLAWVVQTAGLVEKWGAVEPLEEMEVGAALLPLPRHQREPELQHHLGSQPSAHLRCRHSHPRIHSHAHRRGTRPNGPREQPQAWPWWQ